MEDSKNIKTGGVLSDGEVVDEVSSSSTPRKEHHGVVLIPRPSDDPLDPLVSVGPSSKKSKAYKS